MRLRSWLYRRPPRGWADVRRELEAAGVPRVGTEPQASAASQGSGEQPGEDRRRIEIHDAAPRHAERVMDEETIERAAQALWAAAPTGTRLVIFGSHAWGRLGARGDLDFLVIEPEPIADAADEAVRLRRALRGMLLAVDILVVSARSVREWREVPSSMIGAALAEGRELRR
jgi:predicted nucleotidyltransferase